MELLSQEGYFFVLRWIHFMVGITWIGILYYFNFIQTPFFATELGGQSRSAVMRGLVPNALWWFRWGAMLTFLSGWLIVISHMVTGTASLAYYVLILTGGTMGTLMWFNVWFIIWPIQRVAIASAEADPQAAARAPMAGRASRTNTLFSIPMLFFMGAARHFTSLIGAEPAYGLYIIGAGVLILLVELNLVFGTAVTQKPLASVSGTIHAGMWLTLLLFLGASILL